MKKVPATKVVTAPEASESPLPPQIQEALGELVGLFLDSAHELEDRVARLSCMCEPPGPAGSLHVNQPPLRQPFGNARRPPEIPRYDHDDLGRIFYYIKEQIELLLKAQRLAATKTEFLVLQKAA